VTATVRVELPAGLRLLAGIAGGARIVVDLDGAVTPRAILDALEARYPMLRGTMRDQVSGRRRPFVRFFACQRDFSHADPDEALPGAVAEGREAFLVVGAIAGG
jgi:sulfur-carrier protein